MLPAGLGLESAKQLAKMNPSKLILACRNMESAGKAVECIQAEGFNDVEAWEFDQSSIAGVNAFTKRYNESGLDLHVILANAGILPLNPTEAPVLNKDGNEEMYANKLIYSDTDSFLGSNLFDLQTCNQSSRYITAHIGLITIRASYCCQGK